jgi:hypothetical protein
MYVNSCAFATNTGKPAYRERTTATIATQVQILIINLKFCRIADLLFWIEDFEQPFAMLRAVFIYDL